jgi:hypothetical protein
MSFAGHVFDMIARMKANDRRKHRPFDREVDVSGQKIRAEFLKPASDEEIAAVKEMMRHERRKDIRRSVIITVISLLTLIALLSLFR